MTRLAPYSLFAGVLAMAGLPIYIHAPKFYADSFGSLFWGAILVSVVSTVIGFAVRDK